MAEDLHLVLAAPRTSVLNREQPVVSRKTGTLPPSHAAELCKLDIYASSIPKRETATCMNLYHT